jgi:hypothetical protein
MTKRWLTVVAAALVLATAGCGDDKAEPGNVPVPATSSASAPGASSSPASAQAQAPADDPTEDPDVADTADPGADDDTDASVPDDAAPGSGDFVSVVKQKLPQVAADRRDEEIALVAEQACAGLSAGLSADQVTAETRTLGTQDAEATDEATARELVKLAIDTVCLDQAKRVDEF